MIGERTDEAGNKFVLYMTIKRKYADTDEIILDPFAEAKPETLGETLVCLSLLQKTSAALIDNLAAKYGADLSQIGVKK